MHLQEAAAIFVGLEERKLADALNSQSPKDALLSMAMHRQDAAAGKDTMQVATKSKALMQGKSPAKGRVLPRPKRAHAAVKKLTTVHRAVSTFAKKG